MAELSSATFVPGTDPSLYSNKVNQKQYITDRSHTAITTTVYVTATISGITAPQYLLNINTGEIIYAEGVSGAAFTSCTRGADGSTATTMAAGDVLVPIHAGNEWNQLVREIIAITDYISNLDWRPVVDSWTYASATTINVPAGATAIYEKGDKIRLKQGGSYKYYYVTGVASTLLTVTGGSDYTIANDAITDIYYSKVNTPTDFPQWINYTPTPTNLAGGTFNVSEFCVIGGIVKYRVMYTCAGADVSGVITLTIPITMANPLTYDPVGFCSLYDNGTARYVGVVYGTYNSIELKALKTDATYMTDVDTSATVPHTWAANDKISFEISYRMA